MELESYSIEENHVEVRSLFSSLIQQKCHGRAINQILNQVQDCLILVFIFLRRRDAMIPYASINLGWVMNVLVPRGKVRACRSLELFHDFLYDRTRDHSNFYLTYCAARKRLYLNVTFACGDEEYTIFDKFDPDIYYCAYSPAIIVKRNNAHKCAL